MIYKKNMTLSKATTHVSFIIGLLITLKTHSASLIFEPGLGYKQEQLKLTTLTPSTTTKYSMNSPVASLKIHLYSSTGVSLGIAGEYSSGKAETDPTTVDRPEFTHFIGSFQLGVSAMESMKIYLGYAPSNNLEFKTNASFTGFSLKGNSYLAGVVLYPFHRFAIGTQYTVSIYKEIIGANYLSSKDTDLHFQKMDSQDISFTISYLM